MPDKKYIQKVYDFMNTAYGEKGAVTKGVFRGSFNDFYDRINTDSKYADKIYGALSKAYGPMGSLKRDAFSSDITGFRERVLAPSGTQPTTRDIPTGLPEENPYRQFYKRAKIFLFLSNNVLVTSRISKLLSRISKQLNL